MHYGQGFFGFTELGKADIAEPKETKKTEEQRMASGNVANLFKKSENYC